LQTSKIYPPEDKTAPAEVSAVVVKPRSPEKAKPVPAAKPKTTPKAKPKTTNSAAHQINFRV
jgi:hypothetical protein